MDKERCLEIGRLVREYDEAGGPASRGEALAGLMEAVSRAVEAEAEAGGYSEELEEAMGECYGAGW